MHAFARRLVFSTQKKQKRFVTASAQEQSACTNSIIKISLKPFYLRTTENEVVTRAWTSWSRAIMFPSNILWFACRSICLDHLLDYSKLHALRLHLWRTLHRGREIGGSWRRRAPKHGFCLSLICFGTLIYPQSQNQSQMKVLGDPSLFSLGILMFTWHWLDWHGYFDFNGWIPSVRKLKQFYENETSKQNRPIAYKNGAGNWFFLGTAPWSLRHFVFVEFDSLTFNELIILFNSRRNPNPRPNRMFSIPYHFNNIH